MSLDPTTLEADLRKFRAADLDASLLDRLDACTDSTWMELDPLEVRYEERLRGIAPTQLPASLMASLEATLITVPFVDSTIVHFPLKKPKVRQNHRAWWSAAAAVALTGAVTALMIPVGQGPGKVAENRPENHSTIPSPSNNGLVPAGFHRGLSETSDEGVIWQSHNQPQRVLKVVYKDRVTLKDPSGKTYQVEQPRVEYILVPEKTD